MKPPQPRYGNIFAAHENMGLTIADQNRRRRELAAARQRRHRLRKRCGVVPVTVEIEQAAIEELLTEGEILRTT